MTELTLHEKLIDIQQRLKVPKDKRNDYSTSKFMYRNLESIEEAVKPMLKEHGLVLLFSDNVIPVGDRVFVKATATLYDKLAQGMTRTTEISVSAFAQHDEHKKGMDDAQLTGATSSYARKYAAGGLFLIDETKDADSMDNSTRSVEKTVKSEPSKDEPVSNYQRTTIAALLRNLGYETKDTINEYLYDNFGATPQNELEASEVIDAINAQINKRGE